MVFLRSLFDSNSIKRTAWSLFLSKNNVDINSTLLLYSCCLFGLKWRTTLRRTTVHSHGIMIGLPSSWLAEEVVRLNCCSRYFPKKAAKPATTAISMQAASVMQLNTGLERRCLVTRGITAAMEDMQRKIGKKDRIRVSKKAGEDITRVTFNHCWIFKFPPCSSPLRCSQTDSPLFISKPWMAALGLDPWYSILREEGNMACSLSAPTSMSCSSSAWGKPNMKRADRKSKAPQRRKPPHHAPIQRGSSGVMSSLPEQEEGKWAIYSTIHLREVESSKSWVCLLLLIGPHFSSLW